MLIIRKRAYARGALLGNPSDGYNGRTISVIVRNFRAEVVLYEWDSLEIVLAANDRAHFSSVYDLARQPIFRTIKLRRAAGTMNNTKATTFNVTAVHA